MFSNSFNSRRRYLTLSQVYAFQIRTSCNKIDNGSISYVLTPRQIYQLELKTENLLYSSRQIYQLELKTESLLYSLLLYYLDTEQQHLAFFISMESIVWCTVVHVQDRKIKLLMIPINKM